MRTIGLTGGLGSGKTTVAAILRELGAETIDADRVGHEVYAPGTPGWKAVTAAFGSDIVAPDGTIDRAKLGAIVFADHARLAQLEAIVHPLIFQEIQARIAARRGEARGKPIVVEAAVLLEANWRSLVDEVWVVTATPDAVRERIRAQRGWDDARIAARLAAQWSDAERCRHADVVIRNTGSLEELRRQVVEAWQRLIAARRPGDP